MYQIDSSEYKYEDEFGEDYEEVYHQEDILTIQEEYRKNDL